MKEDTIVLTTSNKSSCCKAFINQEFHNHVLSRGNNGIIGHGFRSWSNTELLVSYFCSNCGMIFKPTTNNKLGEYERENKPLVEKLFADTYGAVISSRLLPRQLFLHEEDKENSEKSIVYNEHNLINLFSIGTEIRKVRSLRDDLRSSFEEKPYIIKDGKNIKLVWWAEYVHKNIPFSKKEKREMIAEQKKRKNSGQINKIGDISLEDIDKMSFVVPAKNKPIPKSALLAVKVFHLECRKWFYLPARCVKVV